MATDANFNIKNTYEIWNGQDLKTKQITKSKIIERYVTKGGLISEGAFTLDPS